MTRQPARPDPDRARAAQTVTLAGAALDGVLGLAKITVGVLASSQALIADGIHSLSDLVTDAGVLVVTRFAAAAPDTGHPYGHGRFETLGTLALGAVLLLVAGGLAQDSLLRLMQGRVAVPGAIALLVALAAILAKEWMYRFTRRVAERTDSGLLMANAWHSRSDALSSIAVLIGVGGALAGWLWLDLVAALVVAGMVAWIGWRLIAESARELVDTGLPPDALAEMRLTARGTPGVIDVHELRSRTMGNAVLLDIDIRVAGDISVSEGHQIAERVAATIRASYPVVSEIQVHVDADPAPPELPLRAQAEADLMERWRRLLPASVERLVLHYRPNGVDVEIYLSGEPAPALEKALHSAARELSWFSSVAVWWHP